MEGSGRVPHGTGALPWMPALTGLRGAAALAVVFYHLHFEFHDHAGGPAVPLLRFGWAGVDLFFVLSAYLLMRWMWWSWGDGAVRPWHFVARRWWRIAPAFYASIPVALALTGGLALVWERPLVLVQHLLFVNNMDMAGLTAVNPLYWTLAIETQFYLLLPLFFLLVRRTGPWVLLPVAAAGVAWRWLLYDPQTALYAFYSLPAFLPHFAIGMALADPRFRLPASAARVAGWVGPAAAVALLLVAIPAGDASQAIGSRWQSTAVRPLLAVAVGLTLFGATTAGGWQRFWSVRPLHGLGQMSYSLYLIHVPVILLFRQWPALWEGSFIQYAALPLAASVVAGAALYFLIERPAMTWRDRSGWTALRWRGERMRATPAELPPGRRVGRCDAAPPRGPARVPRPVRPSA